MIFDFDLTKALVNVLLKLFSPIGRAPSIDADNAVADGGQEVVPYISDALKIVDWLR